jgi:hypothetical protein
MANPQEDAHARLLAVRQMDELTKGIGEKFEGVYRDRDKLKTRVSKLEAAMERIGDFNLKVAQPIYVTILEAQLTAMGKEDLLRVAKEMAERLTTPMVVVEHGEDDQG